MSRLFRHVALSPTPIAYVAMSPEPRPAVAWPAGPCRLHPFSRVAHTILTLSPCRPGPLHRVAVSPRSAKPSRP
ncbi:hypothetical protein K438DRAFT_1801293, partial [Mycena galopus ATCC 62051]